MTQTKKTTKTSNTKTTIKSNPKSGSKKVAVKRPYTKKGDKRIILNEKTYTYNTPKDLAKKLDITEQEAKIMIGRPYKIATDLKTGNVMQINLHKKINTQLNSFGTDIKRVSTKVYGPVAEVGNKRFIIRDSLSGFQGGKLNLKIGGHVWLTFYDISDDVSEMINKKIELYTAGNKKAIAFLENDEELESYNIVKRYWSTYFNGYVNEINDKAEETVQTYIGGMAGVILLGYNVEVFSKYTKKKLDWDNVKLRNNISNYTLDGFVNIREVLGNNGNCVKTYLLSKFPQYKKHINKLSDDGVTGKELTNFANKYDISYYLYDVNGNLLEKGENNPKIIISLILYNDHIYELSSTKPKPIKVPELYKIIPNCTERLLRELDNGKCPSNIKLNTRCKPYTYDLGGVSYIENNDYARLLNILTEFKLDQYVGDINLGAKIIDLPYLLEKKFVQDSVDSFFPGSDQFMKVKYSYTNPDVKYDKNLFSACDGNFYYLNSLYKLDYLLTCDYRTSIVEKNPTDVDLHKLYIVEPEKTGGILIPDKNIYWGACVREAEYLGIRLKKLESIECKVMPNTFRKLIDVLMDMYKRNFITRSEFKECYVQWIGGFEAKIKDVISNIDVHVSLKEYDTVDGYHTDLGDSKYILKYNTQKNNPHVFTRKPISIMIKDNARMILNDKLKTFSDLSIIKQIQCDSIVYKGEPLLNLDTDVLGSWKNDTTFTLIESPPIWSNDKNISFYTSQNVEHRDRRPLIYRALYDCWAGVGKTYFAINKIIKQLIESNISYLIVTPSHESKKDYLSAGYNCTVIQDYDFNKYIGTDEVIIFDEIGAGDRKAWEFLYKCNIMCKNYICLGDFRQLLPVTSDVQLNNPPLMHYMFNRFYKLDINMRNNFSISFYDDICNKVIDPLKVVKKYSTKTFSEASIIICYRKKIASYYNNLMIEHLGLKPYTPKVKYMCITNKYTEFYNHQRVTVVEKQGNNIEVRVDDNETLIISRKEFDNNFRLAYAINIHQLQGSTVDSYYYAPEDYRFLTTGRVAYVIVSRIRNKKDNTDPGYEFKFNVKDFWLKSRDEPSKIQNSILDDIDISSDSEDSEDTEDTVDI